MTHLNLISLIDLIIVSSLHDILHVPQIPILEVRIPESQNGLTARVDEHALVVDAVRHLDKVSEQRNVLVNIVP